MHKTTIVFTNILHTLSRANSKHLRNVPELQSLLRLGSLEQLHVLLRVRLLNIALGNLLHHEIGIDINLLAQLAIDDAPLATNRKCADRRFGINKRIDALWHIGDVELVRGLKMNQIGIWI